MASFFKKLVLLSLGALLVSCGASAPEELAEGDFVEIEKPYQKQNIQVPRVLWANIKEILEKEGVSEEVRNNFSLYPTKIAVEIFQVDIGVGKDSKSYRINYPEGGGELDLFDYIDGKGAFRLRLSPTLMNDSPYHLLYVSDSPGRMVGTDKWGNGCGHIFDLSAGADYLMAGNGILVTTGKKQYLHLLAGIYVVFQMVEDRMLLGYIRVTDSRYPQFTCSS